MNDLDPEIWGPYYWFVLHTIAITYPIKANDVAMKKYYEFIHNLPLFIPNTNIGNIFSKLLDNYPVKPYLNNRESFIKWMHFIHNKINMLTDKPLMSYEDAMNTIYHAYKPKKYKMQQKLKEKKMICFVFLLLLIMSIIIYLYNK